MKVFVFAFIFVQTLMPLVIGEIPKERYEEIHKICKGKSNTPLDIIERARKGDFEPSDNLKMYLVCIVEEENCVVNGKLNVDQTVSAIPPAYLAEFEKPVRDCCAEFGNEENLTEAVFKTTQCIASKLSDKFFLP